MIGCAMGLAMGTTDVGTVTGLDYFGARYFSGAQGRFATVDPITVTAARLQDPQTLNLYAYVRNNPLAFVDPDGQDLQVSSDATEEEKKELERRLKRLAPGSRVDQQGQVHAPSGIRRAFNWLTGSGPGTTLVTALVKSNQTTTINTVGGNEARAIAVNSSSQQIGFNLSAATDAQVNIDLNGSWNLPTRTGGPTSTVTAQPVDATLALGHELIHALHITSGTLGTDAFTQVQHTFRIGTQQFSETWLREEFRTVGFKPFVKQGATENAIRHQLGLPARGAYRPQSDWTQH